MKTEENQNDEAPLVVSFTIKEWYMLCEVMRDLTWGKDAAHTWFALQDKVKERLGV